ncbi:hypothetical protein GCM10022235_77280 [Kribbella ginsengisoli]|uniref:Uncharacterized protein n=1 Tax=Kribbella ginsengisoli TaxID=363865 RepID=A0ABP6YZP3_9ACTN
MGGEEVPGVIVYGLLPRGSRRPGFPSGAWILADEVCDWTLYGEVWEVAMWEVPIAIWRTGDEFVVAVRTTLAAVIAGGCRVAWVGAEGLPFCDPPSLLHPDCMSGGVLAWMTDDGSFECPLDPDLPLAPVGDERLLALRRHARGLADAEVGSG